MYVPLIWYCNDSIGEVGETFNNFEERNRWLVEKVHTRTHVILSSKPYLAQRIANDQFLKVQVLNLSITKYFNA